MGMLGVLLGEEARPNIKGLGAGLGSCVLIGGEGVAFRRLVF